MKACKFSSLIAPLSLDKKSTQKIYSRVCLKEMGVDEWELTLYPNEEEDEVTRLQAR